MVPYCAAMLDFWRGAHRGPLRIIRSDGWEDEIPVAHFFEDDLGEGDRRALGRCVGTVLDAGAGAGRHSLALQAAGHQVHAIDVCPELVTTVLPQRGVLSAERADIFTYCPGRTFDTILLLGHGLGLAGSLAGVEELLACCETLLGWNGVLVADSLDVTRTEARVHLDYQKSLTRAGRYRGEMRMHVEYGDLVGEEFGWLHVDITTLSRIACNWDVEPVWEDRHGNYVAQLANPQPVLA